MKVITKTVYTVDELSPDALERAHMDYLSDGDYYHWADENAATLKAFTDIFPVIVRDYEYGYHNYINFEMDNGLDDEVYDFTGIRLAKWLWNNYRDRLYKGKFYSTPGKYVDGKYTYKSRHSKIILDNCCPLTGYCVDDAILAPIYKFMASPDNYQTLEDIMNDCLQSWVYACRDDVEAAESLESFIDMAQANEWTFTKEGKFWTT